MKKWISLAVCAALTVGLLTGCGENKPTGENSAAVDDLTVPHIADNGVGTVYPDKAYGFQLEFPEEGEEIAVMHTDKGDIYFRLFPEAAPKAVENFVTHAKEGYYTDTFFHRVAEEFVIQGGDPEGTGRGGESIWGKDFEDEFDQKLLNLYGALSMANAGPGTNGSQFFINQCHADTFGDRSRYTYEEYLSMYQNYYTLSASMYGESFTSLYPTFESYLSGYIGGIAPLSDMVPDEVWELYEKYGGNINLDGAWREKGGHTVFGQVIAGMGLVDEIAASPVNDDDQPFDKTYIKSIDIVEWNADVKAQAEAILAAEADQPAA